MHRYRSLYRKDGAHQLSAGDGNKASARDNPQPIPTGSLESMDAVHRLNVSGLSELK